MPHPSTTFLLVSLFLVVLPSYTYAFGAGDIPDFAYLNDKAFRHGDIENILESLVKHVGTAAVGGGILGFAKHIIKQASGGSKFSKSDVKKVYFGNWLRDYSQAMDIAGLSKLSADTLVLVVAVLGFMTFGFATEEFEVTADRLGVYLPVEHIDNPKGYAEKEGDAREYHPKLRPPVDPRELEIDERTGMKKYMATEDEGWDTSTAFIRRTFQACIEHGRRAEGQEGADLWEAYRLLGQGLHTMEDLLAHSNWCEIALQKMGHEEVFCHVGDNVIIETPNGPAPPIVTGTFGGADFLHSLIGEAGDHLSQASVTDLSQKLDASQGDNENNNISQLKTLLSKLPIGGGQDKVNETEEIHEKAKAYHFNPDNIAPPEVQKQLLDLLRWRDNVMRDILAKIEMIPGLTDLMDELTNALNAYVYTILTPYLAPILKQATGALDEGSKAVINNQDQYEVFDNPDASDPSHSLLSKDHFGLILNEPAGKIAQIVVEHTVNLIVQTWSNDEDVNGVIDTILEAFHHPYYATGNSQIQHQMFEEMEKWLGGLGPDEAEQVIHALTKESVRDHKNKRIGSEDQNWEEPGYDDRYSSSNTYEQSQQEDRYGSDRAYGGGYGRQSATEGYGKRNEESSGYQSHGRTEYGNEEPTESRYGRQPEYGGAEQDDYVSSVYGRQENRYDGSSQPPRPRADEDKYSQSRQSDEVYGGSGRYSDRGNEEDSYGGGRKRHNEHDSIPYSSGGYKEEPRHASQGYAPSYTQPMERSYGGGDDNRGSDDYGTGSYAERRDNEVGYGGQEKSYGSNYGQRPSGYAPSYGGGDDTFGAERLNIGDDGDNEEHGRHHHGRRRHDEY
ncbi:heterokaryon incompatibility protein Het-C-domain-containing protein [Cyathus striatus]|nr:heterokaryon incompatibility protein Het-C-domain-containing protein [Cyathus striatus]